ncbi:hypothetical protein ILUMI_20306 [Ignelater luminosus]|uniref:Uncharacterized protein n=1 Tax=Ignelater luminosus TaxID=2038154 RepID=A0A8K0G2E9_IGNLU|nr:hypothetical protein ILUMI_20306 [Ignelater luminosus]
MSWRQLNYRHSLQHSYIRQCSMTACSCSYHHVMWNNNKYIRLCKSSNYSSYHKNNFYKYNISGKIQSSSYNRNCLCILQKISCQRIPLCKTQTNNNIGRYICNHFCNRVFCNYNFLLLLI